MLYKYLGYYLLYNQTNIYNCARGTAQKNLEMDVFKTLQIHIPSMERQQEIVQYCQHNDSIIAQLEKEMEYNKIQAESVFSSICKEIDIKPMESMEEATVVDMIYDLHLNPNPIPENTVYETSIENLNIIQVTEQEHKKQRLSLTTTDEHLVYIIKKKNGNIVATEGSVDII